MTQPTDITQILKTAAQGDRAAADRLLPVVYDELRRLAQVHLAKERPGHTLQATELAHEAYLRLVDQSQVEWKNRAHFFAIAALSLRRILVSHARKKSAEKRGHGAGQVSLDEALTIADGIPGTNLLALDIALTKLAQEHPEKARVVEVRFFGGLTNDEASEVLGVPKRTIERHWAYARAWLYRELMPDPMED